MMNNEKIRNSLIRFTLLVLVFIYACFLFIDFFLPDFNQLGNQLKWLSIVILALESVVLVPRITDTRHRIFVRCFQLAAVLTVVCDYSLLFTDRYVIGVAIFCLVQALRLYGMFLKEAPKFLLVGFGLVVLAMVLRQEALLVLLYAFLLVSNFILSYLHYRNNKTSTTESNLPTWLPALAYFLFILCDISVALAFIGVAAHVFSPLQWLFYLPSQVIFIYLLTNESSAQFFTK